LQEILLEIEAETVLSSKSAVRKNIAKT
jgi:hypothetical protein